MGDIAGTIRQPYNRLPALSARLAAMKERLDRQAPAAKGSYMTLCGKWG